MRTSILKSTTAALCGVVLALSSMPAFAQDGDKPAAAEETGPFTITGSITAVSDYRFRGVSLSGEDFAIQPSININHESGLYVGTWVSNLKDTDTYGEAEIDLYAGFSKEIASGTTIDAAVVYYYYPNGTGDSDYFEPYVSLAHTFGPVTAKAGVNWAPSANATGNEDFIYYYGQLSAAIPSTPITLTGRLGKQDLGPASYTEWMLGASATFGKITAGVQYVDTDLGNLPNVDAGFLATLSYAF
jgi:uncharacterized protein (TIGR02001 family)